VSRAARYTNVGAVVVPFGGFVAGVILLWDRAVGWGDLAILAVTYMVTALGVTIGFHRLLTHRSFATHPWVAYVLAVLGSMSVQGPVIGWVADHRKHHAHTDADGDPHSPHVGHGSGVRGLWHAHVGWLLRHEQRGEQSRHAADLLEDRGMRAISDAFVPLVGLSLGIPFALGWLLTGAVADGLTGLLWGGLVRIFFVHHVTWSINSVCHFYGRRRFATTDLSTNVFWLAPVTLGESWHHNHHAFPRSAIHGLRWWELDISGLVIKAMRRLRLAWNVVEITPERQRERLATS
jgi:stearoyl-CoA desaturase (delta-9 desaturase)